MSLCNDFKLTNQISPDRFRPLVSYATVVIYVMMSLTGADLEIYEWWGRVIFARENLRPRPLLLRPRPLYAH